MMVARCRSVEDVLNHNKMQAGGAGYLTVRGCAEKQAGRAVYGVSIEAVCRVLILPRQ